MHDNGKYLITQISANYNTHLIFKYVTEQTETIKDKNTLRLDH